MNGINDKQIIKLAYNPYTNIFNCKSIDNNGGMHTEAAFDSEVASQIHNSATLLKSAEMVLITIDRFFGEGVRHIEIYFEGIKSDFEDFKAFFNFYSKNNNTKISRIIPDVMWQRPRDTFLHLDQIKDRLLLLFNDIPDIQKELAKYNQIKNNVVNLFVAGVQNVGKSTFINTFIGHNILPTSQRIETAATFVVKESRRFAITYFYKDVPYSIVFKDDGITRTQKKHDLPNLTAEIDRVIDNFDTDVYQKITEITVILNKYCKFDLEAKTESSKSFFGKIIIELLHFDVPSRPEKSRMRFVIIDSPGAFAQVEGGSHDKILEESLEDTVSSIAVIITNKVALSHITNRQLLKKISEKSDGQIDIGQSVYIINQAEGLDRQQINEQLDVIHQDPFLNDRYVMFTSAQVANAAKIGGKIEQAYTIKFDDSQPDSLQLYKYSGLPKNHQASFEAVFDEELKTCTDPNRRILINTGYPLIEETIVHSALRYSQLRNVKSTAAIIKKMIGEIRAINQTQKDELAFLCQTSETTLENGISALQGLCSKTFDTFNSELKDLKYHCTPEQTAIKNRFLDAIDCCGKPDFDAQWLPFMKSLMDARKNQQEIKTAINERCREFTNNVKPTLRKTTSEIVDEYTQRFKRQLLSHLSIDNSADTKFLVDNITSYLKTTENFIPTDDFSAKQQIIEPENKSRVERAFSILRGTIYKEYAVRAEEYFNQYIEKSLVEPHFINVCDCINSKITRVNSDIQGELLRLSPNLAGIDENINTLKTKINFTNNCTELLDKIEIYINSLKLNTQTGEFRFE